MTQTKTFIRKKVEGQVLYNDGEFAEIQTSGIEGIEEDLLLKAIQTHRADTSDSPEEFERRFPVGTWLEIITTTEITSALHEQSSNEGFLQ